MSGFRLAVALLWVAAAALAQPAGAFHPGDRPNASPEALLSAPSPAGGVLAASTEPSPAPAKKDTEALASVAVPTAARSAGGPRTTDAGPEVGERLAARPHRQRGPPASA